MIFTKPGTYGEKATLLILLRKVWYQIYESRIFEWKVRPVFLHENDNHNFIFDKKQNLTVQLITYKLVYLTVHLTNFEFVD